MGLLTCKKNLTSTLDSKFNDFETRLKSAIMVTVKEEVESVRKEFNDRIDGLSKKLEDKFLTKMQNQVQQMKSDIKLELQEDSKKLQESISKLQNTYAEAVARTSDAEAQNKRNIVIRNLKCDPKETTDKNVTLNKVNSLVRDGLKLTDVQISAVERKQTRDGKPEVIIATVETTEQKTKLMQNKKSLKKSKQYESVYIEDERPASQRLNEANMRTLLKACGKSGDFIVANGRLLQKRHQQQR